MSDILTIIKPFALEAVADIQTELGDKWALFSPFQKASAQRAATRVLELRVKKKQLQASGASAMDIAAVTEDLEFVKVTVSEFKVAGQIGLASAFEEAFWKGVNKAVEALGSFLVGAGKGIIPGL